MQNIEYTGGDTDFGHSAEPTSMYDSAARNVVNDEFALN